MTRNWFGRVVSVLGLLLIAPLAHAGQFCLAPAGEPMAMAHAIVQDGCARSESAPACLSAPQRLDAATTAAASLAPDAPAADAPRHAHPVALAAAEPRLSAGPAPGFSPPLFILFRRYLS